jgi:hypothetical protein
MVPIRMEPSEAASKGLSTSWCLGVMKQYASRGQPDALFSFVKASRPFHTLSEKSAQQMTMVIGAEALATAGRTHKLLEFYKAAPWDMRSAEFTEIVLGALARLGCVEDVIEVARAASETSSGIAYQRHVIIALATAGNFFGAEGALARARKLSVDRAAMISRNSPSPNGERLSSEPFDACITAAGIAGAPHYARAIFESLATNDVAHASSYSPDSMAEHIASGSRIAFRDEDRSVASALGASAAASNSLPSLTLIARGNVAQKMDNGTLFSSLRTLREAGEVALTPASYVALIEAYGAAGNGAQAFEVWTLLKNRCVFENKRHHAAYNMLDENTWNLPASSFEALLEAQVRACTRSVLEGRGIPAGVLSIQKCIDIFDDMAASAHPAGKTAAAASSVAAMSVFCSCRHFDLDQYLHSLETSEFEAHPTVLAAACTAYSVLAAASATARKDKSASEYAARALRLHQKYFDSALAGCKSVINAQQSSALIRAFASTGNMSECRNLVASIQHAELGPRAEDICAIFDHFSGRAQSIDIATICRALVTIDGLKVLTRNGPALTRLATIEALVGNTKYASELLLLASRSALAEPADILRSFQVIVDAAASASPYAIVSLRDDLDAILKSYSSKYLLECFNDIMSPSFVRDLELKCSHRVFEAVKLADDISSRRQELLPDIDPSHDATLLRSEARLIEIYFAPRVAEFMREAHLAYSALIDAAQSLTEAGDFFSDATRFLRDHVDYVRLSRSESAAELDRRLESIHSVYERRVACVDVAKIFEAPYASFLYHLTKVHDETVTIRLLSGRDMTIRSGGLTAVLAWCALIEEDVVIPTHHAAAIALKGALYDATSASTSVESSVVRLLCEAVSRGFTAPSLHQAGNFTTDFRCQEAARAVMQAATLSDIVIPLRMSLAAASRNGPLVLQLWQQYRIDKKELSSNGGASSLPFSSVMTTEAASSYLAALVVVVESGGDADRADAFHESDGEVDKRIAPVAQPIAAAVILKEVRSTLSEAAGIGRLPQLSDLMCLVRAYVSCGLLPDARVLIRMLLAPISGRDYTHSALIDDAVKDARALSSSLGKEATAWPGQDDILSLGVNSAGLAFGASAWLNISASSSVDIVAASVSARRVTDSALPLSSASFSDIALALSTCGLVDDLPALIDFASNQEVNFVCGPKRLVILDRLAGIAAYSAFAMDGNMASAEAVLSDSRFDFTTVSDGPSSQQIGGPTAASLNAMLRRASDTSAAPIVQRGGAIASGQKALCLLQTLRILGYATNGRVHRALRLTERSVVSRSIMPLSISAVLAAASCLSAEALLVEPPADYRKLALDNPYTNARLLLGGPSVDAGRAAVGINALSYSTASVLARLEAVAASATAPSNSPAPWWSPSSLDVSSILLLYTSVGRPMVAIALGWNHIAMVLRGRQALVSAVLAGGEPDATWTPLYLNDVEELLEDAHALSRLSHVQDDGSSARRARARQADAASRSSMDDDEAIATAASLWGLHRPVPSNSARPHLPPRVKVDAAHAESHFVSPYLIEVLTAAYAVAPAAHYASGVISRNVLGTIASTTTVLRTVYTARAQRNVDIIQNRLRAIGAFPNQAPPSTAIVLSPPYVFFSQALSMMGLMTPQHVLKSPAAYAGDVSLGIRLSRAASWTPLPLSPSSALPAAVLQSYFASIGYQQTQALRPFSRECQSLVARIHCRRFAAIGAGVHDPEANEAEARFSAFKMGISKAEAPKDVAATGGLSLMQPPPSSFLTSDRLQPVTQTSALPLSLASIANRNEFVRALEFEVLGLNSELDSLSASIRATEDALAGAAAAKIASASAPPRSLSELKSALEELEREGNALQDKAAMNLDSRSLLVNWRENDNDLEVEESARSRELERTISDIISLESRYADAVARYEAHSSLGLADESHHGMASLQAMVLGPAAVSIVKMQTLRLQIEGRNRALALDSQRASSEEASVFTSEASVIALRNSLGSRRIALMQTNVAEFRRIDSRINVEMKAEEERLRAVVRDFRERVNEATAGGVSATRHGQQPSDPLWSEAVAKIKAMHLQAQSAVTRKELEMRVIAGTQVSAAIEQERLEGSRSVHEVKERYNAEEVAVTAEFRSKAETAVARLSSTLSAELKPLLEASKAQAQKDSARLAQLRLQASSLEAEIERLTQPAPPAPTSLIVPKSGYDFGSQFAAALSDIADSCPGREYAALAFSIVDEILPAADLDGAIELFRDEIVKF